MDAAKRALSSTSRTRPRRAGAVDASRIEGAMAAHMGGRILRPCVTAPFRSLPACLQLSPEFECRRALLRRAVRLVVVLHVVHRLLRAVDGLLGGVLDLAPGRGKLLLDLRRVLVDRLARLLARLLEGLL